MGWGGYNSRGGRVVFTTIRVAVLCCVPCCLTICSQWGFLTEFGSVLKKKGPHRFIPTMPSVVRSAVAAQTKKKVELKYKKPSDSVPWYMTGIKEQSVVVVLVFF